MRRPDPVASATSGHSLLGGATDRRVEVRPADPRSRHPLRRTTLEEAAKYALISLDSTMRSNVTVGPPIDLLVYGRDELRVTRYRRLDADDPDLKGIRAQWEQALHKAVFELPAIPFR